ncbi:MAG TPA: DUF3368 domain-containing protein [Thermoanaerobaculia bacterium]
MSTLVVISDSSTLIHLSTIGRLSLLREFHGLVTIPPAVWREVVDQGSGRESRQEVEAAHRHGWIEVKTVRDDKLVRLLKRDLDDGEAEVLALAIENKASLVLLDEAEARRIADTLGLRKTGVIGILIRAKLEGKIERLRAELDNLRSKSGFWIDEKLYHRALVEVGEGE